MERHLFTSESVTEGHPDKMCDQISDAILDALMEQDPMSRVACETCTTTGLVMVMGEITTNAYVDIQKIVRDTVREIGYTRGKYGFDADTCGVITAIDEQSADIALGVDKALEAKENKMSEEEIAAIATNKISSPFGTALATYRFAKAKLINLKLAAPAVVAAICGSFIGAQISLRVPEHILSYVLMVILPVSAFLVLNKKLFNDEGSEEITLNRRTYLTATIAAFIVGCYDGFYGPGTGTFLIIAFTVFAHLNIQTANAQAKVINLTTNLTALAIFLYNGQGVLSLGLASAACNMLGGYIGAGLVMKNGSKIARPSIVFVLFLLALKALGVY